MRILISGATGFIGRNLTEAFRNKSWPVDTLSRDDFSSENRLLAKVESADVVIQLSGAPIARRWTRSYKQEIYSSRVYTTGKLTDAIRNARKKPELFISNSAIGILRGDNIYTETNAAYNQGFMADLCKDWENAALAAGDLTRVVVFRLSMVLDRKEGALHKMLWAFRAGIGGRIGSGRQLFSWIHREDLIRSYIHVISKKSIQGVIHVACPDIVTNAQYTKILGRVLRRPAILVIPVLLLRFLYGDAATTLSEGQGARPEKLLGSGFEFKYTTLKDALKELLS